MLKKFKKMIFSPIVMSALVVAGIVFGPASIANWYQPAPPQK